MDLTKRGKPENKKRFKELLNRYPAEPEHKLHEMFRSHFMVTLSFHCG